MRLNTVDFTISQGPKIARYILSFYKTNSKKTKHFIYFGL